MNDALLKERFHATNRQMQEMVRFTLDGRIANGHIKHINDATKENLVDATWLFSLFWLNYLEVGGEEVNESTLKRGNDVLQTVISQYLTEKSCNADGR